MGWYTTQLVPRIVEQGLAVKRTREIRERVCGSLSGRVLELGFGSGFNATFYPPAVTELLAVEPSDVAWSRAAGRIASTSATVTRVGLDGQSLPLEDASADSALSTWTLCTIPDAQLALAEVRRVLKPGGRLRFAEHGLAPDEGVQKWQHRLEPVQKRVAAGCHLARPIDRLLAAAGFEVEDMDRYYVPKEPKPWAAMYEGVARNPG